MYGAAREPVARLVAAIAATEAALEHRELVAPQFAALRSVLATIGIAAAAAPPQQQQQSME